MVEFAHRGKQDLEVRRLCEVICEDLAQGDYAGECLAIYYWVCQNIRYMRDIHDVEFVKEPGQLIKTRAGDCDDMATLLAAMLMAMGNTCDFVLAHFHGDATPSHVYVRVHSPSGPIVLDPVANRDTGKMLGELTNHTVVPV
jgi:transglutaminase-like putative cysteine protease